MLRMLVWWQMEEIEEGAVFSHSPPQPFHLVCNMTSVGSYPEMSQSPPRFYHHHRYHHQQQQQYGHSSSCVDDVLQYSPPHVSDAIGPPQYSQRDIGVDISPVRRMFAISDSDSPSSPLPPSVADVGCPRSPVWSPRPGALRRNAASDDSVFNLCCLNHLQGE